MNTRSSPPATSVELSKDELSLLLYVETCAVDYGGTLEQRRMNAGDFDALEDAWRAAHAERRARAARMLARVESGDLKVRRMGA